MYRLVSNDALTQLLRKKGLSNWDEILEFVQKIPYGRNANRYDFSLVISENKGSCSSKHALLKSVADANSIPVQLLIGIYKMNESNTKIGNILTKNNLEYLPEAHCYLKMNDNYLDVTSRTSNLNAIQSVILKEISIEPFQVCDFKIHFHQEYLKFWISENNISKTFDEIWTIREQCIAALSN